MGNRINSLEFAKYQRQNFGVMPWNLRSKKPYELSLIQLQLKANLVQIVCLGETELVKLLHHLVVLVY